MKIVPLTFVRASFFLCLAATMFTFAGSVFLYFGLPSSWGNLATVVLVSALLLFQKLDFQKMTFSRLAFALFLMITLVPILEMSFGFYGILFSILSPFLAVMLIPDIDQVVGKRGCFRFFLASLWTTIYWIEAMTVGLGWFGFVWGMIIGIFILVV